MNCISVYDDNSIAIYSQDITRIKTKRQDAVEINFLKWYQAHLLNASKLLEVYHIVARDYLSITDKHLLKVRDQDEMY